MEGVNKMEEKETKDKIMWKEELDRKEGRRAILRQQRLREEMI